MVWAWGRSPNPIEPVIASRPATSPGNELANYLAGRLGIAARVENPMLDAIALTDAIFLCTVIGQMAQLGWRTHAVEGDALKFRQAAAEDGITILKAGRSIDDLCREYLVSGSYYVNGDFASLKPTNVLGWLESPMRNKIHRAGIAPLAKRVTRALDELAPSRRRSAPRSDPQKATWELKRKSTAIAKVLNLRPFVVRELAHWDDTSGQRSNLLATSELSVDSIARKAIRLCDADGAASIIGVSVEQFAALRDAGVVCPLIEGRSGHAARYDTRAIHSLLARVIEAVPTEENRTEGLTLEQYQRRTLRSFPAVLEEILSKKLAICGWDSDRQGLSAVLVGPPSTRRARRNVLHDGYVTAAQAAARLCVPTNVVKALVRLGEIRGAERCVKAWGIEVQSLEAFASVFVPANVHSQSLNCPVCKLPAMLKSMGVPIAFSTDQIGVTIVRRDEIDKLLPQGSEPYRNVGIQELFRALQRHFLQSNYGHGMRWIDGESAALILGLGGRVRLSLRILSDGDGALRLLLAGKVKGWTCHTADERLQALWPSRCVQVAPDGAATLQQEWLLESVGTSPERVFDWIEARALALRGLIHQRVGWQAN